MKELLAKFEKLFGLYDQYLIYIEKFKESRRDSRYPDLPGKLRSQVEQHLKSDDATRDYVEPILSYVKSLIGHDSNVGAAFILPIAVIAATIVTLTTAIAYTSKQVKDMREIDLELQKLLGPAERILQTVTKAGSQATLGLGLLAAVAIFLYLKWR